MQVFTLSLFIVFQKSFTIFSGAFTPKILNLSSQDDACKSSSMPNMIVPPLVLAKAEYVSQIDLETPFSAFLYSIVRRSPYFSISSM